MNQIVTCPNCGQKNRLSNVNHVSNQICSKCWTQITPNNDTRKVNQNNKQNNQSKHNNTQKGGFWRILWVIGLAFLVAYLFYFNTNNSTKPVNSSHEPALTNSSPNIPTATSDSYIYKEIELPRVPLPQNGQIQSFTNANKIAPFEIRTSGQGNYLVKLVEIGSQASVMTIFIRGGQSVTTNVPLGRYQVKYASGDSWYGYEELFGSETSYSKADTILNFQDTGYQVSGYSITLYQVQNGNLKTSKISASDF